MINSSPSYWGIPILIEPPTSFMGCPQNTSPTMAAMRCWAVGLWLPKSETQQFGRSEQLGSIWASWHTWHSWQKITRSSFAPAKSLRCAEHFAGHIFRSGCWISEKLGPKTPTDPSTCRKDPCRKDPCRKDLP